MKILLDTSGYIRYFKGAPAFVRRVSGAGRILISPIALGELILGFRKGARFEQNMDNLDRFLQKEAVEQVPIIDVTADRYARIALQLRLQGTPIPSNDMWLAAQAMEHAAELVTSDRHFERIPGLVCSIF